MKHKKHAKVLSLLCILEMMFMLISPGITVCAAESYDPLQSEIPYKHIYTTTDTKVDSVFHYVITAKNRAPFPAEVSERGLFSVNGISGKGIKDGDNKVFNQSGTLTFTFKKPGVYVYELKADRETDSKKQMQAVIHLSPIQSLSLSM